jgi:hypothetical protein
MAYYADIIRLLGNMDLDSDPTEIKEGYYRFAKNIVQTRDNAGTSRATKATKGNTFAVNIGSVSQQNKRYRVYLPDNNDYDMLVEISHPNGGLSGYSWTFVQAPIGGNQAAINFKAQADAFFTSQSQTHVTVLGSGYVDVEWGEYPMMDYTLSVSHRPNGDGRYDCVVIKEAISSDLAGPLIPIQSAMLDRDMFIWSTTQRSAPERIAPQVTNIGPVSGGTYIGPLTLVTFDVPHGLSQGQRIRITHSGHYWMNGLFIVSSVPSPTQIQIPTELVWPGASAPLMPPGTTGSERVFIHPEGMGELGVMTFDQDTETYSYIRLLRSKELNLRTVWTIDRPTVKRNNYRVSMYWTDGAQSENTPRAAYHLGDYAVDSMLGHTNAEEGMYWLGKINEATMHVLPQSRAYVELDSQLEDGGNITAGNKRYVVRLLNRFLVGTSWSIPSKAIPVFAASNTASPFNRILGSEAGTFTGKINVLKVRDVDRYTYDFVELAVIEYGDDNVADAKILKRVPTKAGPIGTVLTPDNELRHDGYEIFTPLALSELIDLPSEIFDRAGNMSVIDSRMVFSDLSKNAESDLTEWAKTFRHRIMRKPIGTVNPDTIGEYQVVDNCVRYVAYMDNEWYRFGIRLRRRDNGKWTKVFHVDDIATDAFVDNLANLTDNRRDQTGGQSNIGEIKADWGITKDWVTNGPINEGSTGSVTYATYLEIFGADLRDSVDGVPIRQVFDRIQVVRPDTVQQVLCTGLAVMSVAIRNHYMPDWTILANGSQNADTSSGFLDRARILVKGDIQGKRIVEFPFFTSIFTKATGSYEQTFTVPFIPANAEVGKGFGRTMCTSGSNLVVFDGAPQSQTRESFVLYNNIISFYSPDHLSGVVDAQTVKEGRYKLRMIAVGHSSVRNGVRDDARWGRVKNGWCEFHPYPVSVPFTDPTFVWKDFPINRSQDVERGGGASLDSFDYTLEGQFLGNFGPQVSSPQFFSGDYRRLIDAVNIAKGNTWGTITTPVGNGRQDIDGAWNLSRVLMLQLPSDYDNASLPNFPVISNINANTGANNSTTPTPFSLPFNPGCFYAQLVRDIDDPYGDPESTVYRHICEEFDVMLSDGEVQKEDWPIFGGDTFTQSSYIKNRYINEETREGQAWGDWDDAFDGSTLNDGQGQDGRAGFGSVFKLFSQNRINSQMRHTTDEQFVFLGDTLDRATLLEETDRKPDEFTYSGAYTPVLLTNTFASFQKTLPVRNESPSRFTWSDPNIEDGLTDGYRQLRPLNIKDLDLTNGKITWHCPMNGELVSWQRDSFMIQFFNARGVLETSNDLNIVIGDGTVMARDGRTLSLIGSEHRESIVIGKSEGGKETAYWLNLITFQVIRFGSDGTVSVSERQPVYSWIRDNAKWAMGEHSPYEMYGIRGVWDEAYKEVLWTFTGKRNSPQWNVGRSYQQASVVTWNDGSQGNFHGLPASYRCRDTHTSSTVSEPGSGAQWESFWELIPRTDSDHYTEFTIAWNEVKNGFSCFYTPMPRIYMPYLDSYITPHPTSPNNMFLHRMGERCKWWELNGASLQDVAFVEAVHNKVPEQNKRYATIQVSSNATPDRIEFETQDQITSLTGPEFVDRDGMFRSPIKDDETQTGSNDAEDAMRGRFLIVRVIFNSLSENTIRNLVVKYFGRLRNVIR